MLLEGLKMMVLGMGIVYIFLILLVYLISLSGTILRPYTKKEIDRLLEQEKKKKAQSTASDTPRETGTIIATITAAIAAHRKDTMRHSKK